jgi:hypothetical protein
MAAGDKMLVFPSQMVEKSTHCANCTAFDGDSTKNMEEWRPLKEMEIARIKAAIEASGIQFPGWDRADIGLKVAELTRTGMDVPAAIKTIEQQLLHAAVAQVGSIENLYMADERYAIVAATEKAINEGKMGRCRGNGVDGKGNPVGFLVFSGYHCHKWNGREGWSVAHEGRPLDPLPGELMERADDAAKAAKKGE